MIARRSELGLDFLPSTLVPALPRAALPGAGARARRGGWLGRLWRLLTRRRRARAARELREYGGRTYTSTARIIPPRRRGRGPLRSGT